MKTTNGKASRAKRQIDQSKDLMVKISSQVEDLSRKDIDKWRMALRMAKDPLRPRRSALQDLYEDISAEGHLKAQMDLRKYATLNTGFQIVNRQDSKVNEAASDLFNQEWFFKLLNELLMSIFYGFSLVEFTRFEGHKIEFSLVPRKLVVPELKTFFPDLSREKGIRYDDPYYALWIIEVGAEKDLGLLNDIVPLIIWKRNAMQSWAEFCEKFGMPIISATTNRSGATELDKMERMLRRLGESAVAIFPEGTQIDFKESNRTDAFQVYDRFIDRNNKEISQRIVGGTMLTEDGSSRSQSQVHERNLNEKVAMADKHYITFLINDRLIPLLISQGYHELSQQDRFVFDQAGELELEKLWMITQGLMSQDYEVETGWIAKTFGVPLKKKELTSKKMPMQAGLRLQRPLDSYLPERHYVLCAKRDFTALKVPFKDQIKRYYEELAEKIWQKKDTLSAQAKLIAAESLALLEGLMEGWGKRRLEISYEAPDHLALSMMEYNLFEFSQSKTEGRIAAMSDLLIDKEKLQIRSFAHFKEAALKLGESFNQNWLRTEYELSIAVGQTSARYLEFTAEKDTVTSFVRYQSAGDSRVREAHQVLNGKIFSLNDKEAMRLWPPNGYGCRCEMVQYIGSAQSREITPGVEGLKKLGDHFIGGAFDINRGSLKEVFTQKQFYSQAKGLKEEFNTLSYKDHNLPDWEELRPKLKALKLDESITPENIAELFKPFESKEGKKSMGFEDYLKRKIILKDQVFKAHTTGKYLSEKEQRHRIFPHLKNILTKPDEVYLTSQKGNVLQTRYIKFYKDKTIVIDTALGNTHLEIKTWYTMKEEEKKIRTGLLINKGGLYKIRS